MVIVERSALTFISFALPESQHIGLAADWKEKKNTYHGDGGRSGEVGGGNAGGTSKHRGYMKTTFG